MRMRNLLSGLTASLSSCRSPGKEIRSGSHWGRDCEAQTFQEGNTIPEQAAQATGSGHPATRAGVLPPSPSLLFLFAASYYLIIFFGHFSAHFPQFVHFSGSMWAILPVTVTAWNSQTFSHILHPIHPTEHTLITSFPLSLELH